MVSTHKIDFYLKKKNYLKKRFSSYYYTKIKMVSTHIIVKNGMEGKFNGVIRVQSASIMRADFAFLYWDPFLGPLLLLYANSHDRDENFSSKQLRSFRWENEIFRWENVLRKKKFFGFYKKISLEKRL